MTCKEALRQLFDKEDAIISRDEVYKRLDELYPDKPWKRSTIYLHLNAYSVNHPFRKHHPHTQGKTFLFWLGEDQFRKWNPTRDGNWVLVDGEVRQEAGAELEEEVLLRSTELSVVTSPISLSIERDLEECLAQKLDMLEPGLSIYAADGVSGRQFNTQTVGIIDLLAIDKQGSFVVVELKAGEAEDKVCGQLLRYMGWVKANLANGKNVRGIIVASDFSEGTRYAVQAVNGAQLKKYEVQFKFSDIS